MVTSMGGQRMATQMIPTPGISNSNNSDSDDINNANNKKLMNVEPSDSVVACPDVTSVSVSQPMRQKQHLAGQSSLILHNIGRMDGGIRSSLQQTAFGLSNGPQNGGLGMMEKNIPVMNSPGMTEGHSAGTLYGNSTKSLSQKFDQHQHRPVTQGDEYGICSVDASGSANLYAPATSVGSMMNNPILNTISMPETDSPMVAANQLSVGSSQQVTALEPQSIDQPQKVKFQSHYPVKEILVQSNQHQQFQQPSHQFQHRQLAQHQVKQKFQMQNLLLLNSDSSNQPQLLSSTIPEATSEIRTEHHDGGLPAKASNPGSNSRATWFFPNPSAPWDVCSLQAQTSGRTQLSFHPQKIVNNSKSDFSSLSGDIAPDAASSGQQDSNSHDIHVSGRLLPDPHLQDEFHKRLTGQDGAQLNNLSSEESVIGLSDTSKPTEPPNKSYTVSRTNNMSRDKQFRNQQRWLLFLRHARRCPAPEGKCHDPNCLTVQELVKHMDICSGFQCIYPRCHATKVLINHQRHCRNASCPVCVPVKNFLQAQFKALACSNLSSGLPSLVNESSKSHDAEIVVRSAPKMISGIVESPEDLHPIKRAKDEKGFEPLVSKSECPFALGSAVSNSRIQDAQHAAKVHDSHIPISEINEVKMEVTASVGHVTPKSIKMRKDNTDYGDTNATHDRARVDIEQVTKTEKEIVQVKMESTLAPFDNTSKYGKPKIKGVSMIELFTPEQVQKHIVGLRQWIGQRKLKAEKNQAMEHSMNENSCQLCAVEKLTFEPPPIYCTPCSDRIKKGASYYSFGSGETRHCFCIRCYNDSRGENIVVDGVTIPKSRADRKKNDEETEEGWVQCDKCNAWQHQICALFNGRRNNGGEAEYTCPNCHVEEVERGERVPLPQSTVLGAKDLPRSNLSDHLEQRLFLKLKQERHDRARLRGKSYDEVVLLFQRIEGVEVCLFGMYVQEFGTECQQPNHRRVYLSYLDSVKYFRPEVKAVSGEALRAFVYHEILIGYLDYCKKHGFTSCYIWACPPLKGEDYILYCHPQIQKTPKSDKLREWYLSMLRKAMKENIVVELTNLYEHFFASNGEYRAKITSARLPYFDGDYWPGAAEDILYQLQKEEEGKKPPKKTLKKSITKRALKASGRTDLSGNASKDLMLMQRLGETISPMKEDFIMVHLQYSCSYCCILMVSETRWVCRQCKNFHLCDKCYDAERKRDDRERHPINHKDVHALYPVEIIEVPDYTKDNENLESEFFDTRQAFLSLCQGNHYQYDTLRRAKHSSIMVLYHLHNPTAPAFVTTCILCHLDIEAGQGWRSEKCPDYELCNACYQKDGGVHHSHKLINNQFIDNDAQNKEARQSRVTQLRKMLDLLVHASQCRSSLCQYPNCRKVKGLFRHGMLCKIRASGGCPLCKKMWYLLQLHARACKESECTVPRCRDLKEHMRRLQQQSDSRRRAAVNEMMRQRAAEVAGSS